MAEVINHDERMSTVPHKEYGSKATANAGLTLGIIGTALGALATFGSNFPILGNWGKPAGTNNTTPIPVTPQDAFIEREVCHNYLDLTKQYYNGRIAEIKELHDAFYDCDTDCG